jgi:ribonucleoside-diphosphate reductase alpha chain
MNDFSMSVLRERCFIRNEKGETTENVEQMFRRVAKAVAAAEKVQLRQKWEEEFYKVMIAMDFLPGSPTLVNAGRKNQMLSSCFVVPIEDSMEGIFGKLTEAATIQKMGGGTGFSFSKLRPKGDVVSSTMGVASGPVSFLSAFDGVSEAIKQGGVRRGANMGILKVDHPDIVEFITCKDKEGVLANFNLSVALTDEFMELVMRDGGVLSLINPRNKIRQSTIEARRLFEMIADQMWKNGEPGVIFIDTINKKHTINAEIESTNPCGEQPLLPYESCNLGSINLANMVEKGVFSEEKLIGVVQVAIRFLDNVIDVNHYPLEKIKVATLANRKIGMGVMGWHDFLIKIGVPYDSDQAIEYIHKVMDIIRETAVETSVELAEEKGVFPNVKNSIYANVTHPPRNAERITIAPTGTISSIAGCSSGIEPHFALAYKRRVLDSEFDITVESLEDMMKRYEFTWSDVIKNNGTLHGIGVPPDIRRIYQTSLEISPHWHIMHQVIFQRYTDAAVSKTINVPNRTTKEEIAKVVLGAWKEGCKGLTIYRDGSRAEQVLSTGSKKLLPANRPEVIDCKAIKIKTGCGSMYTTVGMIEGRVYEVLTSVGKAGGCTNAMMEAVCRLISVSLRKGVSVDEIIDQLEGIRCPHPTPVLPGGKGVLSCPDGIVKAIKTQLSESHVSKHEMFSPCPRCGEKIINSEGCEKCSVCTWTRC